MPRHVLLNNIEHGNLRVVTRYGPEFGDDVHAVPVFPTEFGDLQREYPILFRRESDAGGFQSVALLGLEKGENLFLKGDGWNAGYVPGIVARGPFLIGFQEQEIDGELRREPVIHIDMDNPRVSETDGEPLFLEHGGNTPYLQHIAAILRGIQEGMAAAGAMFAAFESCGLIEPVNIEIDVHDDVQYVLRGFHTVSEDKLAGLESDALKRLNDAGFLRGAFLVVQSLNNISRLIELKRRRVLERARAAGAAGMSA
jgi:hypothetical protein